MTLAHGGAVVAAVSEAAEAAGVKPGMKWGDAQARCRFLAAAPSDPEREARALRSAARMAERYGPWVVRGEDDLLVDVTGTAHLFGGEPAMLEDCRRVFAERGWSVRAAVAGGPGAAWGLARFAPRSLVIGSPEALRGLPVEALRIDAETAARLRRVGLRRIGALADCPRAALTERFGERLVRRLERLLEERAGRAEPIGAAPPRPALRTGWEGMEALIVPEAVEAICAGLLETLCARLRQGDLGARKMRLVLGFDAPGAVPRRIEVRAGRGLRSAGRWLALFRERPGAFDPEGGVVRLDLAVTAAEPFDPSAGSDREALWERLSARLGARSVVCFRPAGRHRPEAAVDAEPVIRASGRTPPFPDGGEGNPRPMRLLVPPERIGVERAGGDPLDPPVALRRRGRAVRLRWADGPERIAFEWWREDESGGRRDAGRYEGGRGRPRRTARRRDGRRGHDGEGPGRHDGDRGHRGAGRRRDGRDHGEPGRGEGGGGAGEGRGGERAGRDYWRVETEGGERLWVYRELRPVPRWFLHGAFP